MKETAAALRGRKYEILASFEDRSRLLIVRSEGSVQTLNTMDVAGLWEQFHGELFRFVRGRVDSDDTARDLLQTAFVKAQRNLASGNTPEHPRAWLYQIVKNLIFDAQQWKRRQLDLATALANEPTLDSFAMDEDVKAFELVARALPAFIDQLDPIYRNALRMTELEGLTQAEAAQRAGVSLSGMKSRVQRGRRMVFQSLQRCCEFEFDVRGHVIGCEPRQSHKCDC